MNSTTAAGTAASPAPAGTGHLKKVLGPVQLWGIPVGLVISGEYFGWSYGWNTAGTLGFLVATVLVATMRESLRRGLTGVGLKDESDLAVLDGERRAPPLPR